MPRTGQASSPETNGAHPKVPPVLLYEHVCRNFRGAKEAVQRTVDGHLFRDATSIRMTLIHLPPGVKFDERKSVGTIAVDLVRRGEDEHRFRCELAGRFQQH